MVSQSSTSARMGATQACKGGEGGAHKHQRPAAASRDRAWGRRSDRAPIAAARGRSAVRQRRPGEGTSRLARGGVPCMRAAWPLTVHEHVAQSTGTFQ